MSPMVGIVSSCKYRAVLFTIVFCNFLPVIVEKLKGKEILPETSCSLYFKDKHWLCSHDERTLYSTNIVKIENFVWDIFTFACMETGKKEV